VNDLLPLGMVVYGTLVAAMNWDSRPRTLRGSLGWLIVVLLVAYVATALTIGFMTGHPSIDPNAGMYE